MKANGYKTCPRCRRFYRMGRLHTCPGVASPQTHAVQPNKCPVCTAYIDTATGDALLGAKPSAGDMCLCLECETPLYYAPDMSLHAFTDEQLDALPPEHVLEIAKATLIARKTKDDMRHGS